MHTSLERTFRTTRVFVTGHTGFKGAWLSLWLARMGARVTGYALAPPSSPSLYEAAGVRELLASEYLEDIRDRTTMVRAVRESEPDFVFHLAAQPLVLAGYETPLETFETNVMGTVNLLEAVRVARRPCVVVVVTTDKCYLNREVVWGYREEDALGGVDPYSASKAGTEIAANSYARSYFRGGSASEPGIRLATARAGNVVGGGDWAENRLVPDIARAIAKGERIRVRNPGAVRPWQHVLEPLAGYLVLASEMATAWKPSLSGAWNFGPRPGEELPVRAMVRKLCSAWGRGEWEERPDAGAPHEAGILRLSIDKALTSLPWRPVWSTEETITKTADWYKGYYETPAFPAREACIRDIESHGAAAERARNERE